MVEEVEEDLLLHLEEEGEEVRPYRGEEEEVEHHPYQVVEVGEEDPDPSHHHQEEVEEGEEDQHLQVEEEVVVEAGDLLLLLGPAYSQAAVSCLET